MAKSKKAKPADKINFSGLIRSLDEKWGHTYEEVKEEESVETKAQTK